MGVYCHVQVRVVKDIGEKHSQSYVLDVLRGSSSAQLKKNNHHTIAGRFAGASGQGPGGGGAPGVHQGLTKEWSKRDMETVLRHLVCVGVLYEKVSKHETFGSISSVLKVRLSQRQVCHGTPGMTSLRTQRALLQGPSENRVQCSVSLQSSAAFFLCFPPPIPLLLSSFSSDAALLPLPGGLTEGHGA